MQSEGSEESVDVSAGTGTPAQPSAGDANTTHTVDQPPSASETEAGTVAGFPINAGEPPQFDPSHLMSCVAYPYADPYFCGLLTAYGGQQAMMYQHMLGAQQLRRPLPSDMTDEEPVYVNAKQYNGIMRRRQSRAKAELENKLVKSRKPYMHESRHLHAKRRARGCGGRFLKAKSDEDIKSSSDGEPREHVLQGGNIAN